MDPEFFYEVRKTTREATIAEAREAIKGSRNVVNNVVLRPNAGYFGNQESDTEEVSTESMEEIYHQPESLGLKKILKVTTKLNCLCQHVPKEDNKNCLNGKKSLVLKELFTRIYRTSG